MGRFLTPSKVALLALAQVYCKGSIPISSTPTVSSILISHIVPSKTDGTGLISNQSENSILDFERALAGQQSIVPGRTVWDILLKEVWAIDCADALECFIDDLPALLGKTRDELLRERDEGLPPQPAGRIVRTSPLGAFIRRCHLEWNRLQFQDSAALWMDFVAYRLPSKGAFTRKNPKALRSPFDTNLAELGVDGNHPLTSIIFRPLLDSTSEERNVASAYDLEKLMEFQISEMQNIGGRLPDEIKARLKQMANMGASTPKMSYYLRFLDSWRAGDFTSAFDNLHRYFDYAMQNRDRTFYQFALLNLAILHAEFGCYDEAMPAMQEAIATARENRDTVCLNYCMSWLYHFCRAFPDQMAAVRDTGILGNETEGLSFLKSRAKEAEMWGPLSTTLLSEARLNLQQGKSLALSFENIVKSSHISMIKAVPHGNGPSLIMKSTLFSRVGQTHQAFSCGERFLLCHTKESMLEDSMKCTVRQAALLAQMGRVKESELVLSEVNPAIFNVLKYRNYYTPAALISRAHRLLHKSQLGPATQVIDQLLSQQPIHDFDLSSQVTLLHIDLLTRRHEYAAAMKELQSLADKAAVYENEVYMDARLMTLKADLLAKTGNAHQGFSLAARAIDMSYRARMLPALWEACLAMGRILLESYEFTAVRDLVVAILPQILVCLDCDLAGRAYMLLADAFVGLAGVEGAEAESGETEQGGKASGKRKLKQEGLMGRAMDTLEKASERFRWIEELQGQLECYAKMGKIHMWRGDTALANEVGEKYLSLSKEYAEVET